MHPTVDAQAAPAGFRPGELIALEDLLALPDERRWGRDSEGRLCLAGPKSADGHQFPSTWLVRLLNAALKPPLTVMPEGSLVLPELRRLGGAPLPESRLGPRGIEPDVVVFRDRPRPVPPRKGKAKSYRVDEVGLVVEVLSDTTFRSDLGQGEADEVDRWRSFLLSGIPELWLLNVDVEAPCPLPAGSGLFLRNAGEAWEPLSGDHLVHGASAVHGLRPVTAGVVRSTVPGFVFDVGAFWRDIEPPAD